MTSRFKPLPKRCMSFDASLTAASYVVEQRSRTRIRFHVTLPGALTPLFVENTRFEATRSDWRILVPTIRFSSEGSRQPSLAHRFVEISRFANFLSADELSTLDPDRIVEAFLRDYHRALTNAHLTVRIGTPEEARRDAGPRRCAARPASLDHRQLGCRALFRGRRNRTMLRLGPPPRKPTQPAGCFLPYRPTTSHTAIGHTRPATELSSRYPLASWPTRPN